LLWSTLSVVSGELQSAFGSEPVKRLLLSERIDNDEMLSRTEEMDPEK